jgi:aminobenzoyl-glutamate utilization protein B
VTTRLYELVDQAVEQTTQVIKRIANEVWQFAELSLQEIKSAQLIINILQEQGFSITSKGTALCLSTFSRDEASFRASRVDH